MSVSLTIENNVATLLLNRSEQKNAISLAMWHSIVEYSKQIKASDAKVVVIRGAAHTFSAGANLAEIANLKTIDDALHYWTAIKNGVDAVANLVTPTVAVVEGHCIGGGCMIALACDLRIAASNAQFALPETKLGFVCDKASVARLVYLVGGAAAADILLTGELKNAEQALRLGLVSEIVLADKLVSRANHLAGTLAANSKESAALVKKQLLSLNQKQVAAINQNDEDRIIAESFLNPAVQERIKHLIASRK